MKRWLGIPAMPRMTPEQNAAFLTHRAPLRTHMLKTAVITVLGFYLCCYLFDLFLLRDVAVLGAVLRFGVILPLAIGLLFYLAGDHPIERKEIAAILVAMFANVAWCVIMLASDSPAVLTYFYAASTFQMAITLAAASPFRPALRASIFTFCLNYSAIFFLEGVSLGYIVQHLVVYMPTVVMTLLVSHHLEVEARIGYLQASENEALKRELSRQNKDLARLSVTDPLTRLSNRRGTDLELLRLRNEAPDDAGKAILLVVDIDHFKAFNDAYGHGAGDQCLKRVARAMRRALPVDAHFARHGGEEFLAIIAGATPETAIQIAESLRRSVRQLGIAHDFTGDRNRHVTISIGATSGSIASTSAFERLMERADRALYAAKADGRNSWRVDIAETEEVTFPIYGHPVVEPQAGDEETRVVA
ncbi:diguanylate cyclase domain-containing protein [Rhizobium sp. G187]|uniref:GGDEF domain-containing protein n=1 Tax=Rhizobium sp. G187 TaxID=3451352 RepID=UPI003EE514D3